MCSGGGVGGGSSRNIIGHPSATPLSHSDDDDDDDDNWSFSVVVVVAPIPFVHWGVKYDNMRLARPRVRSNPVML